MPIREKLKRLTSMMSPKKLAFASGLNATTVFRYMSGKSIPRSDKAIALSEALGVDVHWLLDDRMDWPPIYVDVHEAVGDAA